MSILSADDVVSLAKMSNIQLTEEETDSLRRDIEEILGYIAQLSDIDTSGIEPTYQVTGLQNVFRRDVITESNVSREQLLAMASESTDQQVKVPKVL